VPPLGGVARPCSCFPSHTHAGACTCAGAVRRPVYLRWRARSNSLEECICKSVLVPLCTHVGKLAAVLSPNQFPATTACRDGCAVIKSYYQNRQLSLRKTARRVISLRRLWPTETREATRTTLSRAPPGSSNFLYHVHRYRHSLWRRLDARENADKECAGRQPTDGPSRLIGRIIAAVGGLGWSTSVARVAGVATGAGAGGGGGGGGSGKSGGRGGSGKASVGGAVSALAGFGAAVRSGGLNAHVGALGLSDLRGRSAVEVVSPIAEHLCRCPGSVPTALVRPTLCISRGSVSFFEARTCPKGRSVILSCVRARRTCCAIWNQCSFLSSSGPRPARILPGTRLKVYGIAGTASRVSVGGRR